EMNKDVQLTYVSDGDVMVATAITPKPKEPKDNPYGRGNAAVVASDSAGPQYKRGRPGATGGTSDGRTATSLARGAQGIGAFTGQGRMGIETNALSGLQSGVKGAHGQRLNLLIKQAQNAFNEENWPKAKSSLQELITADPGRWEFYRALGYVDFSTGGFAEAIHDYDQAVQLVQGEPESRKAEIGQLLTEEGYIYLQMGKINQ